jgi:hypothetical protein
VAERLNAVTNLCSLLTSRRLMVTAHNGVVARFESSPSPRQTPGFSGEDALALNQRRDGSSPSPGSDTFHIRVAKWQRGRLLTVSSQVRLLPLVQRPWRPTGRALAF